MNRYRDPLTLAAALALSALAYFAIAPHGPITVNAQAADTNAHYLGGITLANITNHIISHNGTNLTDNGVVIGGGGIAGAVINTTVANAPAKPDASKTNLVAMTGADLNSIGGVTAATTNSASLAWLNSSNQLTAATSAQALSQVGPVFVDTSTGTVTIALSQSFSYYLKSGVANPLNLVGNSATNTIYGDQIWVRSAYIGTNFYLNY